MVAHAQCEELVVDVVHVGQEGVLAVAQAVDHDADDVEAGDDNQGEGHDEGVGDAYAFARLAGAGHAELHDESAEHEADGLAAAVAHEYLAAALGTAEDVEVEEGQERAEGGKGDGGVGMDAGAHEEAAQEEEGYDTEAGGEAVDAVDEVDGVDDVDDDDCGERHADGLGEGVDAEKAVEVVNPHAGGYNHAGTDGLHGKLCLVAHADEVVGEPFKVEKEHRAQGKPHAGLHAEPAGERTGAGGEGCNPGGKGQGDDNGGGEGDAAKAGNGAGMDFASVVVVEEFLLVGDEDDFRENHPRGQRGKKEG